VTEAQIRFLRPAFYDDDLKLTVKPEDWGSSRIAFYYEMRRIGEDKLLCTGITRHCFINHNGKPTRMPAELHKLLSEIGNKCD